MRRGGPSDSPVSMVRLVQLGQSMYSGTTSPFVRASRSNVVRLSCVGVRGHVRDYWRLSVEEVRAEALKLADCQDALVTLGYDNSNKQRGCG